MVQKRESPHKMNPIKKQFSLNRAVARQQFSVISLGVLLALLHGLAYGQSASRADKGPEAGAKLTEAPIKWVAPSSFDPDLPGMGLPQLPGCKSQVIYDPLMCRSAVDEGGDGRYESVLHGTFNHHQGFVLYQDKIIAWWSNHARDENGPGQRVIGRWGTWVGDSASADARINWGYVPSFVEFMPPPVPVRRRWWHVDPYVIQPYIDGSLSVRNGKLYSIGQVTCIGGWTTEELLRRPTGPLPPEKWNDRLDLSRGFRYDLWYDVGPQFAQRWTFRDGQLVPDSPMYRMTPDVSRIEVTPGRWKPVAPLIPPYVNMIPIENAPEDIRLDILGAPKPAGTPPPAPRPTHAPGTSSHAADGKHGLAHSTEFERPDGKLVSVRDNLQNPGHYYAAVRNSREDYYPPAIETDLVGGAAPVSGRLPDGRVWLLCNSPSNYLVAHENSRKDMFITVSRDGITFDKTWLVFHSDRKSDGGIYKFGGPQYFVTRIIGENMWIVYSITKEQIGITKLPLSSLH